MQYTLQPPKRWRPGEVYKCEETGKLVSIRPFNRKSASTHPSIFSLFCLDNNGIAEPVSGLFATCSEGVFSGDTWNPKKTEQLYFKVYTMKSGIFIEGLEELGL